MMSKATPRPWRVREHPANADEFHVSAKCPPDDPYYGRCEETEIMSDEDYPRKRADAELIVSAVNAHDALVAACEAARDFIAGAPLAGAYADDASRIQMQLEASLAAAKGE